MKVAASILIIFIFASVLVAQNNEAEITLPDSVMKRVVERLVTYNFKPRKLPTTIYFANSSSSWKLDRDWLPKISNIDFVVKDEVEETNATEAYRIEILDRKKSRYSIGFGFGPIGLGCGEGKTWSLIVTERGIRLWPDGGFYAWCSDANA